VKKVRMFAKPATQYKKSQLNEHQTPSRFVFCEKSTGLTRFQAEGASDRNSTVERMAGMLAMQCLVRGHDPADFAVLVPADEGFCEQLVSRAAALLEEGRAVANPGGLSPRQREILQSVVRNRANKEIASRLNITVRTVKFHISALLEKFGVANRGDLARRAAGMLHQEVSEGETAPAPEPSLAAGNGIAGKAAMAYVLPSTMKGRSVRFPGTMLSA
jgi:DNA-binding CsgD family transcriptional regulator